MPPRLSQTSEITQGAIDAAIEVQMDKGLGLLVSICERCLQKLKC